MIKGLILMFISWLAVVSGIGGYTKSTEEHSLVYYLLMILFIIANALLGVYW